MRLTLKTKLVLSIALPLLLAYAVMLVCEYNLGRRQALRNMESYLKELAARWAAELDGELMAAEELARTLALVVTSEADPAAERLRMLLMESLRSNPRVFGMCLALEPGTKLADTGGFAPYYCRGDDDGGDDLRYVDIAALSPPYTHRAWYRDAKLADRPVWSEPYFDEGAGERFMCTYSAVIRREAGFAGVWTADILSDDLLRHFSRLEMGETYCMLVSGKGTIISHPEEELVMRESVFSLAARGGVEELAAAGKRMVAGEAGVCKIRDWRTGDPKWMVFAPIESAGWSLAAVIPEDDVMAPIHARLARSLAILVAGLGIIVGIVYLMAARVTRPVARLAEAAESLGRGDLDARVSGVKGSDEIAQLARQFNAMVGELKENVEGRIREEAARREVEGELNAAREIQAALLPAVPPRREDEPFLLHAVNAPAKTVAGDFFDFFFVDDRRLALVMADVSGKGIPAALYMAVARTKLRDFSGPEKTPERIVGELNRRLAEENDQAMFLSLFFGLYDVRTGELIYVNAGHNPPYLVRGENPLRTLEPTGPLVAVFPDAVFENGSCRLDPGDLLFTFTDGVTEAHAKGGELFGENRLEGLLRADCTSPPDALCEIVVKTISEFSLGDLKDDVTVLALRRTQAAEERREDAAAACAEATA